MNIQEKSQIRTMIQSPQWRTIEQVAKDMVQGFREDDTLKSTADETLIATALKEGRIQGINKFIQELYRLAQND